MYYVVVTVCLKLYVQDEFLTKLEYRSSAPESFVKVSPEDVVRVEGSERVLSSEWNDAVRYDANRWGDIFAKLRQNLGKYSSMTLRGKL